jgi:hypothetical protein
MTFRATFPLVSSLHFSLTLQMQDVYKDVPDYTASQAKELTTAARP